jgi:zinc protease
MAFEILYPVKENLHLPEKSDIAKLWDEVKRMDLKPWVKENKTNDLTNLKIPLMGKVIRTKKNSPPFGYTKWLFSNGVNVWFKNTGYEESDVQVYGYKPGGYSQVSLADLPSALSYNELSLSSSGFVGTEETTVFSFLDKYESTISAVGTTVNLKMLLQDIYLRMTIYKKEQSVFDNWKTKRLEQISSKSVEPKVVFGDTLTAIMSNHNLRALSLLNLKVLNRVHYEKVMALHKRFFRNANGFTFIITGNLNIDTVKALAETWLGGLPAIAKCDTTIIDHNMYPPKGIVKKHFIKKMQTPQSTITIGYTGQIPYTVDNNVLMVFCEELLKMRYTETIREKEGGSYGVAVSGQLIRRPKGRFIFQINFDTAPDPIKKDKLISIVYQEINKLIIEGPEKEKIDMIRKNELKNYFEDANRKSARYWGGNAGALLLYGIDLVTDYDKRLLSVTPIQIQEFAKRIFSQGNQIEVVMDPK